MSTTTLQVKEELNSREEKLNSWKFLYWYFVDVCFSISAQYELENRIKGQDSRRIIFSKQIELMGKLKSEWREQMESEKLKILEENPFHDSSY